MTREELEAVLLKDYGEAHKASVTEALLRIDSQAYVVLSDAELLMLANGAVRLIQREGS